MFEVDESELRFKKEMTGEELVKDVLDEDHVGGISDNKGKSYWWNTIDKKKRYYVIKWTHSRLLQPVDYTYYRIEEL